jgi:phosphoglycerol transferase MdoB-like AlkP superfamily enzyme
MEAYKKFFWNSATFDKSLGFEQQFYEDDYVMTDKIGWGLSDEAFFLQSIEKIKKLPTPFYAFLRTLSTHAPFAHITRDIDNFPLHDLEGEVIGYYIRSVHYVDSAIGKFLHKLSEYSLRSNAIIVIYGDHRSRLPESELKRMGINDLREIRKIPLIISIPNFEQKGERDTIGGLIDLTPTICNILGIDIADKFFIGRDLGNGDRSFVIFKDGSYVSMRDSMNKINAAEQLKISDLILEKNMIQVIRNGQKCQ